MEKALKKLMRNHYNTTGHGRIFLGLNFITCRQCPYHAHACNGKIIEHNKDYTTHRTVAKF